MGNVFSQCVKRNPESDSEIPKKSHKQNDGKRNSNKERAHTNGNGIPMANGIHPNPDIIAQHLSELQSKMDDRLKLPLDYYYKMDHKNRGLALIFNHEFFNDRTLGARRGTQVDRDRLHRTFTHLGFDVRTFDNPTEIDIRGILKKVAAMDHSDNDCLVVIVLSHGELVPYHDFNTGDESTTILSHDLMSYVHSMDTKYPLQLIWTYFTDENCPTLKNKPRLFLIQACQGSQTDPGMRLVSKRSTTTESDSVEDNLDNRRAFERINVRPSFVQRGMSIDETDGVPYEPIKVKPVLPQRDFLIAYASLPGYYSFRNTLSGAWFIQSLCKELDERRDDADFMQILTLVNQEVAFNYESHSYDQELDLKKQIPCVVSMLTKLVLFPKTQHIANGH